MREREHTPRIDGDRKLSPLSNWPRYPGGALAGALIAIASILLFFVGVPRPSLLIPAVIILAVVLWALRSRLDS